MTDVKNQPAAAFTNDRLDLKRLVDAAARARLERGNPNDPRNRTATGDLRCQANTYDGHRCKYRVRGLGSIYCTVHRKQRERIEA